MDSINAWVDPEEVKRIAESLLADVEQEGDWETERSSGVVKVEPAREKDVIRLSAEKSLAEASKLASSSGMLSGDQKTKPEQESNAVPAPVKPVKLSPPTELRADEKHEQQVKANGVLEKLDEWIRKETAAIGVCMVDRDGDVLHTSMDNAAWTGLVISSASMAENPDGRSIRLKVFGGASLQLIPVATSRGGIVIGILLGNPVAQSEAIELAKKSEQIANG